MLLVLIALSTLGCKGRFKLPKDARFVQALAMGNGRVCARMKDGSARCFGEGESEQVPDLPCGLASDADAGCAGPAAPTCRIEADRTVTCALRADGSRTKVEGLADVVSLSVSETHACAVRAWGGVACWGRNESGELGDGTTIDRLEPVDVAGLVLPGRQVAAGRAHTCLLMGDASLRCWGANDAHQLADGSTTARSKPGAALPGLFSVLGVVAAGDATCARMDDGSARCWGGLRLPKTEGDRVPVPMEVRW